MNTENAERVENPPVLDTEDDRLLDIVWDNIEAESDAPHEPFDEGKHP